MSYRLSGLLTKLAFLVSIFLIGNLQNEFSSTAQQIRFAITPKILKHVSLGFNFVLADLLWIRLLQSLFDRTNIETGWQYQMLEGITDLDQRNLLAYRIGATALSVGVDDIEGARRIYEKGAKQFPTDWSLLFRTGYHYLYEVKNCNRAAYFFGEAVKYGAPLWVAALVARLYTKEGQYKIARVALMDSIQRFKGTNIEPMLQERLIDLDRAEHGLPSKYGEADILKVCVPKNEKPKQKSKAAGRK